MNWGLLVSSHSVKIHGFVAGVYLFVAIAEIGTRPQWPWKGLKWLVEFQKASTPWYNNDICNIRSGSHIYQQRRSSQCCDSALLPCFPRWPGSGDRFFKSSGNQPEYRNRVHTDATTASTGSWTCGHVDVGGLSWLKLASMWTLSLCSDWLAWKLWFETPVPTLCAMTDESNLLKCQSLEHEIKKIASEL